MSIQDSWKFVLLQYGLKEVTVQFTTPEQRKWILLNVPIHIVQEKSTHQTMFINTVATSRFPRANLEDSSSEESLLSTHQVCDTESDYPKELKVDADFIAVCMMHLSKYRTLALLGNLGSGRRTLANQIARRLSEIEKLKIEVFDSFRVIPAYSSETFLPTIIIVPDLIKPWFTDTHTEDIIQFLQQLRLDKENNCFIIATFQYEYWSNINPLSKLHENILSVFFELIPVNTEIERLREIAWNSENDISDEVLKRICEVNTSIGRPMNLALIVKYQAFRDYRYFIDPILFTIKQLKELENSDNMREGIKFKALFFTMLHGGEIAKSKLEEKLDHALLVDLMDTMDRKETIHRCIHHLKNVYIKETTDGKSYKMIHDVFTKCTFLAAVENNFELLFTECHYFPLLECIRHKSALEKIKFYRNIVFDNERLQVGIPTQFYPMIAKIFVQRNELMNMYHAIRFFENKKFQVEWLKATHT